MAGQRALREVGNRRALTMENQAVPVAREVLSLTSMVIPIKTMLRGVEMLVGEVFGTLNRLPSPA